MRTRAALALLFLALQGCRFAVENAPIVVSAESLTLVWEAGEPGGAPKAAAYRIYYRRHGSSGWTRIGEVPAESGASFTLTHAELGDGSYDFAVSALSGDGRSSPLHSSTDPDASPLGGWHVVWVTGK